MVRIIPMRTAGGDKEVISISVMREVEYPGEKVCEQRDLRSLQLLLLRGEMGMVSAGVY